MPRTSFDDWFDRELAELKAGLEKLEASLEPRLSQPIAEPEPAPRPAKRAKRSGGRARKVAAPRPAAQQQSVADDRPAPAAVPEPPSVSTSATSAPASRSASPAPTPPPSNTEAQRVPSPPPRPSGSDLSDPKNFGLEPPVGELARGSSVPEDYRQRLMRHIAFSTRVLHTSGVPAAVWREWRAFERAAQDKLRELNTRPPDPDLVG